MWQFLRIFPPKVFHKSFTKMFLILQFNPHSLLCRVLTFFQSPSSEFELLAEPPLDLGRGKIDDCIVWQKFLKGFDRFDRASGLSGKVSRWLWCSRCQRCWRRTSWIYMSSWIPAVERILIIVLRENNCIETQVVRVWQMTYLAAALKYYYSNVFAGVEIQNAM